ncbi:Zn-dependent exopeptidase [Aureobasidium subglaciale]|nr:Zn-dependent exopeptidase [Aureobasidium subglaciale]KAI5214471.1 Zn-dependent exopeptidase [Aureobasidium subglaciale]KAI5217224.1 Zn-dependent exopeptidase [Aureobasidium subglaciale]KAI5254963.1 Zn-dependent exopeptidase [Aureobasidium subglaciale]
MHFSALVVASLASACLAAPSLAADQQPIGASEHNSIGSSWSKELISLHRHLISTESISGNEYDVGKWLSKHLKHEGWAIETQMVNGDKSRLNILAYPGKVRNADLLISSHIDTVPPFYPYKIQSNDSETIISGRGSVDAKASVAAQIIATKKLLAEKKLKPDDVALLYVVGEEVHGDGMRAANALKLTPKTIIFGEPTEGKLATGHKGMLGFTLNAFGKAAHSGYPWLGRSANEVLVKALTALMQLSLELPKSEKYGFTTINLGKIEGGVAGNVVAQNASAQIAIRIAAGTPDEIGKRVQEVIKAATNEFKTPGHEDEEMFEIVFAGKGYAPVDIDHDVEGFGTITVNYGTDIPNLDKLDGQKRYLYGPGSILVAHSDHEAITLSDLETAVKDYEKLILHSLS